MQTTLSKSDTSAALAAPRAALWTGYVLTGLVVAFLVFDIAVKLIRSPFAVEPTVQLGYHAEQVVVIGLIELVCLVLCLFPRTAVLGTILMTGYFGGAVATNMRASTPTFNQVFPVVMGALLWIGLMLRERRLWALMPIRNG